MLRISHGDPYSPHSPSALQGGAREFIGDRDRAEARLTTPWYLAILEPFGGLRVPDDAEGRDPLAFEK